MRVRIRTPLVLASLVGLAAVVFLSVAHLVAARDRGEPFQAATQAKGEREKAQKRGESPKARATLPAAPGDGRASEARHANPKIAATDALLRTLETEIPTKDLPRTLGTLLEYLTDRMGSVGKDLPFYVDVKGFPNLRAGLDGQIPPPVLKYPPHPARMSIGAILQMALDQVDDGEATFLIRKHRVEITTKKAAELSNLLKQTFTAAFDHQPLEFVLDDLSEITGVSVVLDARARDQGRTAVTARFRNDVPVLDALRMVTASAGLTLVELPGGAASCRALFVTTPEYAQSLKRK